MEKRLSRQIGNGMSEIHVPQLTYAHWARLF